MSLGAAPELVSDLGAHDGTIRRHIRSIFEVGELDALYGNILVSALIVNKDIVCFDIYYTLVAITGAIHKVTLTSMHDILIM